MTSSSSTPPPPPRPQANCCTYCGAPVRWQFREKYNAWRSIDVDTDQEHACDHTEMPSTVKIGHCEHCGQVVKYEKGRPHEFYFYPDVEHRWCSGVVG